MKGALRMKETNSKTLGSTSTRLPPSLHMDLEHLQWVLWRVWLGQQALWSSLTIRENVSFTTERNARLIDSSVKSRPTVAVYHGLWQLMTTSTHRWPHSKNDYFPTGTCLLRPREGSLCEKPKLEGQKLFGSLFWPLCGHCRWIAQTNRDGRFHHFLPKTFLSHPNLGFQSLTDELSHHGDVDGRKERLFHLQKAVANSIEMEEYGLTAMQEKYTMYKEGNIEFLRFNPDEETSKNKPTFSRLPSNPQIYARLLQLLQWSTRH